MSLVVKGVVDKRRDVQDHDHVTIVVSEIYLAHTMIETRGLWLLEGNMASIMLEACLLTLFAVSSVI